MGCFPLILLALLSFANAEFVEIYSPRVTNWGHTYDWSECPSGMFAYGMQIKYEEDQRGGDDTALNAVSLYCNKPDWNQYSKENWIMSGEGRWGKWQEIKYCPNGTLIVGFALRSEPHQGYGDDAAADNFAAYCGLVDGPRNRDTWLEGNTVGWGGWTADQWCPQEFAVCAIRSQIEGNQDAGDDTALNNVDLKCCRASCTLNRKLYRVHKHDNFESDKVGGGEFYKKIGFTRTTDSTEPISMEEKRLLYNKSYTDVTIRGYGIYNGYAINRSVIVDDRRRVKSMTIKAKDLEAMVYHAMMEEQVVHEFFPVPFGKIAVIDQLFLTCGNIQVSLAMTRTRHIDPPPGIPNFG